MEEKKPVACKLIKLTEANHKFLYDQGKYGETMNDVFARLLKNQIKKWEKSNER